MNTKNRSTRERRPKSGGRALSLPQQSNRYSGKDPNGHHEMILPCHDSALTPSVESVESVVKFLWLPFFRTALLCPRCGLCVRCFSVQLPGRHSSSPSPLGLQDCVSPNLNKVERNLNIQNQPKHLFPNHLQRHPPPNLNILPIVEGHDVPPLGAVQLPRRQHKLQMKDL
jgi:hypothetical protein